MAELMVRLPGCNFQPRFSPLQLLCWMPRVWLRGFGHSELPTSISQWQLKTCSSPKPAALLPLPATPTSGSWDKFRSSISTDTKLIIFPPFLSLPPQRSEDWSESCRGAPWREYEGGPVAELSHPYWEDVISYGTGEMWLGNTISSLSHPARCKCLRTLQVLTWLLLWITLLQCIETTKNWSHKFMLQYPLECLSARH